MKVTIVMNRFGHLEIWHGDRTDEECDNYVQSEEGIDDVLDTLSAEDRDDLNNGWDVTIGDPDELMEMLP